MVKVLIIVSTSALSLYSHRIKHMFPAFKDGAGQWLDSDGVGPVS